MGIDQLFAPFDHFAEQCHLAATGHRQQVADLQVGRHRIPAKPEGCIDASLIQQSRQDPAMHPAPPALKGFGQTNASKSQVPMDVPLKDGPKTRIVIRPANKAAIVLHQFHGRFLGMQGKTSLDGMVPSGTVDGGDLAVEGPKVIQEPYAEQTNREQVEQPRRPFSHVESVRPEGT